jgi:pyruvate, water dikinase
MAIDQRQERTVWLEDLRSGDVDRVGGKNASLGEMIAELSREGIVTPAGFATTAAAYREFIEHNELEPVIREHSEKASKGGAALKKAGEAIRNAFEKSDTPEGLAESIKNAYRELGERLERAEPSVAVRSSATAEDLPEASFAGQQETFLNIRGERALLKAVKRCFASLFTDRAISYREKKGFDHLDVALSVGVQEMVRADTGAAGVMFTIDTETGFEEAIVIDASWGLGETVVGGEVDPDEYVVSKPLLGTEGIVPILSKRLGRKLIKCVYAKGGGKDIKTVDTSAKERDATVLDDETILKLASWGKRIEAHYGRPMDIEWARDGETGELKIVQARPETVQSQKKTGTLTTFTLRERSKELARGLAIGQAVAAGAVRVLKDPSEGDKLKEGEVLVAPATDPDWGPLLERAAAVVTDRGGRTAHAAIVSRELGIPAIVGAGDATERLKDGQAVTISCAEGDEGIVYEGELEYESAEVDLSDLPETRTRIMINLASPAAAFRWRKLPVKGVGLARLEFVIMNAIKAHPMALATFDRLEDKAVKKQIREITRGYEDPAWFFVDKLAQGIARIAASQWPEPVVVRTSDFKTNEYADLVGGELFEPKEENPMLGLRGASRYTSERYREAFALECKALKRVREEIGLENVIVMIPFCRTPEEADGVLEAMAAEGLVRGRKGLEIYCMAEVPSNVVMAREFAQRFDGFSIGTNDLTQLVLGVDRDSADLAKIFNERHESVKRTVRTLIEGAHAEGITIGICGQAPSDYPDFAEFLVESGIDSISLNPDSVVETIKRVAAIEEKLAARGKP